MGDRPADLPEALGRRISDGSFTSGLSVAEFAACLELGLEPVGLAQGFCAMQWSTYAMGGAFARGIAPYGGGQGGYVENYQCPHGMVSGEHRVWGQNYQQTWIEDAWLKGFSSAYSRMLEEAQALGAHGVIGVVDTVGHLSDLGIIEFHLRGTAVSVPGATAPPTPWSTYLAGQRLVKVIEAGFAPVAIVAAVASVRVWAYCMTEYLMGGTAGFFGGASDPVEIAQIVAAQLTAREIVRSSARTQLHGDSLHGASVSVLEREFEKGDLEIQALLRGNRLRRFKEFDALAVPRATVRLS